MNDKNYLVVWETFDEEVSGVEKGEYTEEDAKVKVKSLQPLGNPVRYIVMSKEVAKEEGYI